MTKITSFKTLRQVKEMILKEPSRWKLSSAMNTAC